MKNESTADRIIRLVAAGVFLYLGIAVLAGILQIIAFVFAATMFVTSVFGFCPLYTLCKINTRAEQ